MLIVERSVADTIFSLAVESYPFEGCGLMLGKVENGDNVALSAYPVPNRWPVEEERRVRFRIDEGDMLEAELLAAELGLDVIGVFHSHPDHPPEASPRDLAWATWNGYSYLITEARDGIHGQSRSWQLSADRSGFCEEKIVITDRQEVNLSS